MESQDFLVPGINFQDFSVSPDETVIIKSENDQSEESNPIISENNTETFSDSSEDPLKIIESPGIPCTSQDVVGTIFENIHIIYENKEDHSSLFSKPVTRSESEDVVNQFSLLTKYHHPCEDIQRNGLQLFMENNQLARIIRRNYHHIQAYIQPTFSLPKETLKNNIFGQELPLNLCYTNNITEPDQEICLFTPKPELEEEFLIIPIIKAKNEEVKTEDMLLFSQLDQLTNNMGQDNNYQMIQEIDSVNQPGPSYSLQDVEGTSFEMMGNTFGHKLPVDLSNFCKVEGIKHETKTSHFVKYKLHEGKHIKVWECGICGKEFGHQYTLMRHLPTHTDERKFQCNTCGKAFRQMSTLSQHRAIHSSERPYVCEICQKTFNRVSTLISHRKTHTGLKPHRCHLCNKAFHQKGNLRNHIFTHTNERPYKCDICDKGFNQMSNLMCHKLKAHQRADKPKYICQICGKDFPKRMGLRNHEQYQHGLTKEKMEIPEVTRYENAIYVDPINTEAMQLAIESNQTPFALLRPLTGIPVLVRVLPAGNKQMLVPASADDLKKYGQISITKVEAEENSGIVKNEKQDGTTVQIKIPVVATVIQQSGLGGHVSTSVVSPGPNSEDPNTGCPITDNYVFTTNIQVVDNQDDINAGSYEPNYITNQLMEDAQIEFLDSQNKEFQHLNATHNLFEELKSPDMMADTSDSTDIQNDMNLSMSNTLNRNADLPYIIL